MSDIENQKQPLFASIAAIIVQARKTAYKNNNSILLKTYWKIGEIIVENEQDGKTKALYGKSTLKNLANLLTIEFGKGFDERNLNNIRAFYLAFPIWNAVRTELSWTHYRIISRVESEQLRLQYIEHSSDEGWDTRTLQRNIKTQYVGRILDDKITQKPVPENIIKDPYIF